MADVLAIEGGTPVRSNPLPPWPCIPEEDIAVASEILRSGKINYWTGDAGRNFENDFARAVGSQFAIALANGTVALELPLKAYGVGPGDEVIVTPRSFIASVSCVVTVGAKPVFAEVDPGSQNITAETIRRVITPRTKAIIAVHLAGWPCDMDPIMALAAEKGLIVIEDCAQSHGARYKGRPVGSIGHAAAWSFCQDKIITTAGEGGMLTTNDRAIWEYCWSYKDHGKSWDAMQSVKGKVGFQWVHASFGTNWRLSEVQSALGRQALSRLDSDISKRRSNAHKLADALKEFPCVRVPGPDPDIFHSYYKFYCFVRPELLADGWSRDQVMQAVAAEGVPCLAGSCSEIYLERAFPPDLRPPERLPVAKQLGETSLMTLVHPTLTEADIDDVATAFSKVLTRAST